MTRGESLAPGFRFHPTDEELVRYYLKRKVTNKPFRFDPISFTDVYKSEPWDLPGKSKLKSRDLEWYFFSVLDKKYGNGSKTNRATEKGYWKTTGKDRAVRWNSQTVGMKKTLVYHLGRAPHGERTNWVMHEYRLADEELEKAGVAQDAFVLCRIFKKSGSGPKNGEQYGAPFVEEDWDNDEQVPVLPGALLSSAEEVTVPYEEFAETTDLDQASIRQNFDVLTSENASPMNSYDGTNYFTEQSADFVNTGLKSLVDGVIIGNPGDLSADNTDLLPGQHIMDSQSVKDVFGEQSSNNVDIADFDYSFDPCFVDNSHTEDFFGSNNGNLNLVEPDPLVDSTGFDLVEDYLNFFDAEDDNLVFDPYELFGSENAANDQGPSFKKDFMGESVEESIADSKKSEVLANHDASSSNKKPEPVEFEPDTKPSYIKQMLGGIPASPAFASDFPMKGSNLQINPGQSSTSVHATAGIIRIESRPFAGDSVERPFGNSRDLNITLSFGLSQVNPTYPSSMPVSSLFSGKAGSLISLDCLFFISLWILLLSVSHKLGVYVCHIVISVQ